MSTISGRLVILMSMTILMACNDGSDDAVNSVSVASAKANEAHAVDAGAGTVNSIPDWFPQNIHLPADFRVGDSRKFGENTLFLAGDSAESADVLLATYQASLAEAGFEVMDRDDLDTQYLIVFTGPGWDQNSVRINDQGETRRLEISLTRMSD